MSLLKAVPKPIRDDTPDPCEIVLKGHFGSDGALMKLVNHLREIGMVKQGRFERCQDGTAKQTLTLSVYERAANAYHATTGDDMDFKTWWEASNDWFVVRAACEAAYQAVQSTSESQK